MVAGDTNQSYDIFVHDTQTGITSRVSVASDGTEGNDDPRNFSELSADGRYVAFASYASNLVNGDTNGDRDVFLHENHIIPVVRAITRADLNPTNAANVRFRVIFSEDVTGVGQDDFAISTAGTLSGTQITEVITDTLSTYTITVATGTGVGILRLEIPESASITDQIGNPLAALPYITGEAYIIYQEIFYIPLMARSAP